ncbi:YjjG family noncanonical pyrimidine nucleotidase [Aequorivita lipolytica]|uniref:Noncanonical pyrimidine nucleotidase, YjjG family n=1 Tax=Aequorivita lipolytica TaxID=153267 RepID=A0A5C6YTS9_9FLAO|nr:YjjG family noncanonical pyrimidine nucleotidase [Aequorivita lipolytica]TXD70892.1 noncanonical pyrimidine nucleotidase, YjjG family [Aequorivita lipolytica]SRX49946.1 Pyrimidine 5'-nucleotidase YjjG [Aequorivita lipolytica]
MKDRGITDVFFDLDHTLWDFDKNSGLAFERVFKKHKIELPLTDFLKEYEPINFDYWKKYREDRVTKEELRRGRLTETFAIFKIKFSLDIIDSLAHCYIEELPVNNHLFLGAVETLEYLSAKYKLHIITNGFEEVQYLKLQNSGIKKYFNTITTSEEVGLKKPHPVMFETALKKASVLAGKSIMIGDSLEADIIGAKNVGMHTLLFNYRNEIVTDPYFIINNLAEIKNHL